MSEELNTCQECGMVTLKNDYHPYAACLMFKACKDSKVVEANLRAVSQQALDEGRKDLLEISDLLRQAKAKMIGQYSHGIPDIRKMVYRARKKLEALLSRG